MLTRKDQEQILDHFNTSGGPPETSPELPAKPENVRKEKIASA